MKTLTLYHGTNDIFDEFSNDFLSGDDSIDQYGSGFYFYTTPAKTALHGYIRVTATVTINKTINVSKFKRVPLDVVESLICVAPDMESVLENFGDINQLGFDKVLKIAVKSYRDLDVIDCLNSIGNDFFHKKDTHILLSKYAKLTGYDALYVKERNIYVILTKKQISITNVISIDEE